MYKENQNKLINIVDDGDIIHVFITAPSKKKQKVEDALKSSFRELSKIYGGSLENELDYELLHDCNEIPDYLDNYIDYERFGRELMYDGFHEYSNGIIEIRR